MKEDYSILKDKVSEMNKLQDEISFINWNKDDGYKFSSIEEMKEFNEKLENGDFDYLFTGSDEVKVPTIEIIENYSHKFGSMLINVFLIEKNKEFITFMTITNNDDNDMLENLCRNQNESKQNAYTHFNTLKDEVTTNSIDDILKSLITGAEKTIISLKNKLALLTSEN